MNKFFILEGGNLTIAIFFLLIAIFISTRPFIRNGVKKFILFATIAMFSLLIAGHYMITSSRMAGVKKAFNEDKEVVCESRMNRKAAQSISIKKSNGWSLDGDVFTNPNYERVFHTSRCIEPK